MAQLDTNVLASIGQSGADVTGSMAKAYQLKDMIDMNQLRQMEIRKAQSEAEDAGKIRTLAGQFDLSTSEGQNQFTGAVSKINPRAAMQFQKEFSDTQHGQNVLLEDQYKLLGEQSNLVSQMVGPLAAQAAQMKAAGRSPQEIDAALLPRVMQTVEQGKQMTLSNGRPAMGEEDLKHISQILQQGNLGEALPQILSQSQRGREMAQQFLQQRNIESEIANRQTQRQQKEREIGIAERSEQRKASQAAIAAKGGLTDDAKDMIAEQIVAGRQPRELLANLGRGAQGASDLRDIQNRVASAAKQKGISPQGLFAATQEMAAMGKAIGEAGRREGAIASSVREAKKFAEAAGKASEELPRGQFVPLNKLEQMIAKGASDPKLAAFNARTTSFINAYVKATSGGGSSDAASREHARQMLSTAMSPAAYKAVIEALINEAELAEQSPREVISEMTGRTAEGGSQQVAPPSPALGAVAPPSPPRAGAGAAPRRVWTPQGIQQVP